MDDKHADENAPEIDTERKGNLGDLSEGAGHTFDQTNGLVDGLAGNADDPDQVDDRLNEGDQDQSGA